MATDPLTAAVSSFRLDGRRALVTGATRGIGAAVAEALAAAGADLVLTARTVGDIEAMAASLAARYGIRTAAVPADLMTADGVERLAAESLAVFGGLDVLVNNAGISYPERVVDVSADLWDAVMAVNLRAPALLGSRIGRAMVAAGTGGKIVNMASAAGLRALDEHYAYCASKAGLIMATKVQALELGPHGIQSNVVCPTVIMTEMGQRVWGEQAKAAPMLARIPAGHFGAPRHVADVVVFLASSAADMVNGVELPVDGGYTAT
jgi:NAD(P)-dependent dehydrogenase (short-subunit alcohol dehydrogenase family)